MWGCQGTLWIKFLPKQILTLMQPLSCLLMFCLCLVILLRHLVLHLYDCLHSSHIRIQVNILVKSGIQSAIMRAHSRREKILWTSSTKKGQDYIIYLTTAQRLNRQLGVKGTNWLPSWLKRLVVQYQVQLTCNEFKHMFCDCADLLPVWCFSWLRR